LNSGRFVNGVLEPFIGDGEPDKEDKTKKDKEDGASQEDNGKFFRTQ
jgi:hypothetical protein